MGNKIEQTRESYKPERINYLLIAEAPPAENSGRFFYFDYVAKFDSLFIETMKVLYPDDSKDIARLREHKKEYLERFMNDGFYLIDAVTEPMLNNSKAYKLRKIKESLEDLKIRIQKTINEDTKIILISSTVYEVCNEALKSTGLNIINKCMIEFPGSGQQKKFRGKMFELLGGKEEDKFIWPDSFQNWDRLIKQCENISGWSEEAKLKAKDAFSFLKEELGGHFLKETWDARHPLRFYITNMVPWTRNVIARYASGLRSLKTQCNYESLIKRFISADKFSEAVTILETAYSLHNSGFDIVFDPKIVVMGKEKIPDLKIINTKTSEELLVEVSSSSISKAEIEVNRTFDTISHKLIFSTKQIVYAGKVHRYISPKHLEKILVAIDGLIDKACDDGGLYEYIEESLVEIAIAPVKEKELVDKWAISKGLSCAALEGSIIQSDEISRLKSKIAKEKNQLLPDKPNVLILENKVLTFNIIYNQIDVESVIEGLEETLYTYPQILFLIIYSTNIFFEKDILLRKVSRDVHKYIERLEGDNYFGQYFILFNKFSEYKVSDSTHDSIIKAFS